MGRPILAAAAFQAASVAHLIFLATRQILPTIPMTTARNLERKCFYVNGSDLASANGLTITAPAGATVLLNINGATDSLSNFQITLNGTDDTHVLYNFYQATALTDSSVSIEGSVLAPYAAVSGSGAHINGTLVANSFSGGLEQHEFLFQGNLPASTPEPGTWVTFVAGLGLVWLGRWRVSRRKDTD